MNEHPTLFRQEKAAGAALLCCLLVGFAPQARAELPPHVHVLEARLDRDFGYVMGSLLRQTIRVEADAGFTLEDGLIPQAQGAVNDWLEVRASGWEKEDRGGRTVYRISLDYQVFKGVREAENLTVPAVPLSLRRDREVVETEAPPLPFTLNPLIPPGIADESVSIRGLQPPPASADSPHGTKLALALAALAALLLFAARHLGLPPFRPRAGRPFASALHGIRRLRRLPPSVETWGEALRLFHAALNGHAGRTVLESHLPRLFREHPELGSVRAEMEALFALSHRAFFAAEKPDAPADGEFSRLEELCRRCRAIERRRT